MTAIIDEFNKAFRIMAHADKEATKPKSLGDAFAFYYKLTIIPLVLFVLLSGLFTYLLGAFVATATGTALNSALGTITSSVGLGARTLPALADIGTKLFAAVGAWYVIAFPILVLWVLVPILILIFAVFYQAVGMFLKTAKPNAFATTVTATIYGIAPLIALYWLTTIAFVGPAIYAILLVFTFFVLLAVLSNMHKASRVETFITEVISVALIFVAVAIVVDLIVSVAVLALV